MVFPIYKQLTVPNLISTAFSLVGDFFFLTTPLHVIEPVDNRFCTHDLIVEDD